jgi:hypothetical protein
MQAPGPGTPGGPRAGTPGRDPGPGPRNARDGNSRDGNSQDGNSQDGNSLDGNSQDGNGQDGNGQDGNGQDGNGLDGNPGRGTAGTGTAGTGIAGTGTGGWGRAAVGVCGFVSLGGSASVWRRDAGRGTASHQSNSYTTYVDYQRTRILALPYCSIYVRSFAQRTAVLRTVPQGRRRPLLGGPAPRRDLHEENDCR